VGLGQSIRHTNSVRILSFKRDLRLNVWAPTRLVPVSFMILQRHGIAHPFRWLREGWTWAGYPTLLPTPISPWWNWDTHPSTRFRQPHIRHPIPLSKPNHWHWPDQRIKFFTSDLSCHFRPEHGESRYVHARKLPAFFRRRLP